MEPMTGKCAFVVGGTHSGCGKTTIALALMAAFRDRGLKVQPFKVGPDFIDPGFHTRITGMESRNLDGWMLSGEYNRTLFRRLLEQADMAIVEGVMGLFDGYDGVTESGSSAEMAKWLGLPVVLVVDARSMARSAAALVYGFRSFDPGLRLAGVIFNQIGGEGHLSYLREAMSATIPEIPVIGGIPRDEPIRLPERHLGLVTADETSLGPEWERRLGQLVERYLDLDLLQQLWVDPWKGSEEAKGEPLRDEVSKSRERGEEVLIAVARDAAFCFYYPDNFELLRKAGADIHFFSPLSGESLPADAAGLYLGGGYPELFALELSSQQGFIEAIRGALFRGMPIYAECGGLMVLSRFIDTIEGNRYPMAGILPFGTRMLQRRKALGYTEVVLQEGCLLGERGTGIRGHEFHYSEIIEEESDAALSFSYRIHARKSERDRPEGYSVGSALASYVHLHWGSAPEAASNLVKRCREYRAKVK